jgi:hypothetical protein
MRLAGKTSLLALGAVIVGVSVVLRLSGAEQEDPLPSTVVQSQPVSSPTPLASTPKPEREESSGIAFGKARTPKNLFVEGSKAIDPDPSSEVKALQPPSWFIYIGYSFGSQSYVPVFQPNPEGLYPVRTASTPSCTDPSPYRDMIKQSNELGEKLLGAWFRADVSVRLLEGKAENSVDRGDFGLLVAVSEPMTPTQQKSFLRELGSETGVAIENIELIGPPESFDQKHDWVEGTPYTSGRKGREADS